jgi:hypothetical protein
MLIVKANLWHWVGVSYVWQHMIFDFGLEFLNNFDYGGWQRNLARSFKEERLVSRIKGDE